MLVLEPDSPFKVTRGERREATIGEQNVRDKRETGREVLCGRLLCTENVVFFRLLEVLKLFDDFH